MTVQFPSTHGHTADTDAARGLPDLHDRVTEAYFGKMGEAFARSTRERIHWICSNVAGTRVLDVGCSQGIASIILGREQKSVTGIDVAKRSIDEAREYLALEARNVQDNVTFRHGDFRTTDLGAAKFDTVIMSEVLEHLADPGAFIVAAAERLADDGTLIVTVPFGVNDWPDHKHTFYLLEPWKLVSRHFEVSEVKLFGKWIGFVGRKRPVPLDGEIMPAMTVVGQVEEAVQQLERGLLERIGALSDRVHDLQSELLSANHQNGALKKKCAETELALKAAEERLLARQAESNDRAERILELEELIKVLERRIDHAQTERLSSERDLARLSAELSAAEGRAERFRADAARHEQAVERERNMRSDAETKALLAEDRHQGSIRRLEETQSLLQNKSDEVSTLTSRLNQLRAEREDQEREFKRLTDELESARIGENRSKEELQKLARLLESEQKARSLADRKLGEAIRNVSDLSKDLNRSRDHLTSKQAQIDSLVSSIDELQSEITRRDERIENLTLSLERIEETALQWLEVLDRQTVELNEFKEKLEASQEQAAENHNAALAAETKLRSAEQRIEKITQERFEESKLLAAQLEEQKSATTKIEQTLADARRQIVSKDNAESVLRQTLKAAEEKVQSSLSDLEATRKELDSEKGLHRSTFSKLEAAKASERSALLRCEDLQRQLQQSATRAMALRSQLQTAEREKAFAESRALRTRNMISFQLGYALIQAGKSWHGFRTLPGKLLEISRDAKRRREGKTVAGSIPSSVRVAPLVTKQAFSAAALKSLKIACVMDEFTYASFASEAILEQLTPTDWREQLETFNPEMLFIESAWRGKDELWGNKVGHRSSELVDIVEWCKQRRITTVFWNKEDPVHFETFLNTAALFDHVFTTDIDCIGRYKATLNHDNVWFLPFACPANRFNPVETHQRKKAFSFAGAYYARYPERNRDLESFVSALSEKYQVEIYDRNYGKDDPRYQFPEDFQPFIVGHLPFEEIEQAYKGYTHAINMNSIKQSQSMFARRVFELLGCNTITVSNFSRGVRMLFGDLVICTDNGTEVMRRLDSIADEVTARKYRLLGLRKVMQEHTAQDRIAYVAAKAFGKPLPALLPDVLVTAYAKNSDQLEAILANYRRQAYVRKRLCVVVPNGFTHSFQKEETLSIIQAVELDGLTVSSIAGDAKFVAGMVPDDYYGANYLTDLALATRYFDGEAIGKSAYFIRERSGKVVLSLPQQRYKAVTQVSARTSLIAANTISQIPAVEWATSLFTRAVECSKALSIDEFNYCRNGAGSPGCTIVEDLFGVDNGLGMKDLIARAESIGPDMSADASTNLSGADLSKFFKKAKSQNATFTVEGQDWLVSSSLPDGKHDYIYASQDLNPAELGLSTGGELHLETSPGLNIQFVLLYLDGKKHRLGHEIIQSNNNATCSLPQSTAFIRLGLRLYGPGTASIKALIKGHKSITPCAILGRSKHLVLSNHYPQYDDLYRNGFVHRRVTGYRKAGLSTDVFRLRPGSSLSFGEFENVDVTTGGPEALDKLLSEGGYQSVAVHFLDHIMWQVLRRHSKTRICVWVHGAEIQPWYRREYNFRSEAEKHSEKVKSDERIGFWRALLSDFPRNLHLVFVSKHFAEEVMDDLGFRLPNENYSILHNPIDTELFSYREKDAGQRKRILSIRTFATRKYANDLSVAAILALKHRPFFHELEFRLIGDGDLFEQTTAPLRGLPNVVLEQRFLPQAEIAVLQKDYGVFLNPTRWDSQGVSRDEAMSSGLVPVTSNTAAIPEFVDETCGYLAEPEDAAGLAAAIADLYENPNKFLALSKAAAERVRRQSDSRKIIEQEIAIMQGSAQGATR